MILSPTMIYKRITEKHDPNGNYFEDGDRLFEYLIVEDNEVNDYIAKGEWVRTPFGEEIPAKTKAAKK